MTMPRRHRQPSQARALSRGVRAWTWRVDVAAVRRLPEGVIEGLSGGEDSMGAEQPPAPKPQAKVAVLRPRDAAPLIIVDSSAGEPRVLLGRRRLDMVFMPGRYVFPGGRVDPSDKQVTVAEDLRPSDLEKLLVAMKGTPSVARARALALAAVRETFEEAGLLIGTPLGAGAPPKAANWLAFFATGYRPALG